MVTVHLRTDSAAAVAIAAAVVVAETLAEGAGGRARQSWL